MPIHDWTRVEAGIFHHFHHSWIEEIQRVLNGGLLPDEFYAMQEQQAAGYGPDVLTLQIADPELEAPSGGNGTATATLVPPKARFTFETDAEFYRRKKSTVVVRHSATIESSQWSKSFLPETKREVTPSGRFWTKRAICWSTRSTC